MARLAWTTVWVAMAYLDSGNSRRAAARCSCTGALARHTAKREWWTPIPTLRSCAFRLQLPLTTEPRGWALRPMPYPRRLQRTRPLPTAAEMAPVTPSPTVTTGQNVMRRTVSAPGHEAPLRPVPLSMTPDLEVRVVLPRSPSAACRARSATDLPTEGGDAVCGVRVDASQERPTTPPSRGGPVAIEAVQDVLQDEHEDQQSIISRTHYPY